MVDKNTGRLRTLGELGFDRAGKKSDDDAKNRTSASSAALSSEHPLQKEERKETMKWIRNITSQIKSGDYRPSGERKLVGRLDNDILKFMEENKYELKNENISIGDRDLVHALRSSKVNPLPISTWDRLVEILERPEAIYWDNTKAGLIYAFKEGEDFGKIIILPNYQTRIERKVAFTNTVRTGRTILSMEEFRDATHYKKIK